MIEPITNLREVLVFVAAPADVNAERDCLEQIVASLNRTVARHQGLVLKPLRWDRDAIPEAGRPQGVTNKQLGNHQVFIGIMWKRFGSPTGKGESGTEEEFNLAYQRFETTGQPRIMMYFCERAIPPRDLDLDQYARVRAFREASAVRGLANTYTEIDDFCNQVRDHLTEISFRLGKDQVPPPDLPQSSALAGSREDDAPGVVAAFRAPPDRNPLEKVTGRNVMLGLSKSEVDYIVSYLVKNNFNIDASWGGVRNLRRDLARQNPQRPARTNAPFWLSRYPVSNEEFAYFVAQRKHQTIAERMKAPTNWRVEMERRGPDHPVTCVAFVDAEEFCKWAGVRLPTDEEFERAIRGADQRLFPWGSRWDKGHCNDIYWSGHESTGTSPVHYFKKWRSSDEICDLTGNVFEWVVLSESADGRQALKGGAFDRSAVVRGNAAASMLASQDYHAPNVGFRFAKDLV